MSVSGKAIASFIYKLLLSFISFLNGALTARYLSQKADRLDFQFAGTISNAGMTYVGGYSGYYAWALSKKPEEAEEIVQMGNLFMFVLSLFIWVVTVILLLIMGPNFHQAWLWAFLCMPFSFLFGFGSRLLQGTNEISWLNRVNMAQPTLFLIIYLPLYFDKHLPESLRLSITYISWTATFAVAAAASMLVAYHVMPQKKVRRWKYWTTHWKEMWRYGNWLSLSNLVNIVNYRIDFWLVAAFIPANIAADYAIAVTASEVLLNISTSVQQVVFTRMSSASRSDAIALTELSTRQTFLSSVIVAVGMYIVFPWLIVFAFGTRYQGAITPFYILLPGLIIKSTSNVVLQYFQNQLGKPETTIWMNGLSAVINGILCVIFLPSLGLVGGAIASTGSYVLSYIVYVAWFARVNHVPSSGLWRIRRSDLAPYITLVRRFLPLRK